MNHRAGKLRDSRQSSFNLFLYPCTNYAFTFAFAPLRLCVRLLSFRNRQFPKSALGALLFLMLLSPRLAVAAEDPTQAEFDRVAKMTFAEQQAWLAQLEQRATRAARLTLSPGEAAQQQLHIRSLLHQKTATWKALREVIDDINAREKAAKAVEIAKPQAAEKPRAIEKLAEKAVAKSQTANNSKVVKRIVAKPQVEAEDASGQRGQGSVKGNQDSVKVNVDELDARIAGCNLAIREFETQLDEKGAWNAARLEPLAERLKVLVERHGDLGLFRDVATKEQRSAVTELEGAKSAISQLGVRVVEARKLADSPEFTGSDAERKAELDRLEAISRRLVELSGK